MKLICIFLFAASLLSGQHVYWRILLTNSCGGAGATSISEFTMYDAGGLQIPTTGGSASASTSVGGLPASSAFDGNPSTFWASTSRATSSSPQWLQYQFSSGVSVASFTLTLRSGNLEQSPIDVTLQYSDDGSTWTSLGQYNGLDWQSSGQVSESLGLRNSYPQSGIHTAWRLTISGNNGFGDGTVSIAELKFYDLSNAQISTGGFADLYSSLPASVPAGGGGAFDGNAATFWASDTTANDPSKYVGYVFTGSYSLGSFSITNGPTLSQSPNSFCIQSSVDASLWTTVKCYTAATWTTSGQTQTFVVLQPGASTAVIF
jgi:hypothetical protein